MPRSPSRDAHDPFGALRAPYVAPFALGRTVASLGSQFVSVAIGWELYERTRDPWALGLVGAVQVAPALAVTLPAGALSDRLVRRNIALVAHSLIGLAALALALISSASAPIAFVYLLLGLTGTARAFAQPAVNSLLAQLLEPRLYGNAHAWMVSGSQLAQIGGPAAAGLLIAIFGLAFPCYLLAGVGNLVFVATLLALPAQAPPHPGSHRGLADLFAGASFIRRTPVFLSAITLDLFAVLLGGAVALLPIFARDILGVGPAGLGLLRSAPALGALVAALVVTRIRPWQRPGRVLLLVVGGFGLATIGFGLAREVWLALACLFAAGAFDSISMVIRAVLEQAITPDRLRGRVSAINSLFIGLSNELGAFESGAVAALFGPVQAVVAGGVGTLLVVALIALACPSLVRLAPLHTLQPREPATQPAL